MSYPPETEHAPVLNATRARQGRWGSHIFWVLVFGTLLAALGMFGAWTWKSTTEPVPVGQGNERVDGKLTSDTPAPPTPTLQKPPAPPPQP